MNLWVDFFVHEQTKGVCYADQDICNNWIVEWDSVPDSPPLAAQQEQRQVYGWELMSPQERAQHREKMRSLETEQAREQYRMEHHRRMQKRAEQQGVTLPDTPQPRGHGQGGPGRGR